MRDRGSQPATFDRARVVEAVRSFPYEGCLHRAIVGRAVLRAIMGIEATIVFGTARSSRRPQVAASGSSCMAKQS